ncbi:MAG: FecR domain-containing protein, partial [Gammaproteobacteria bacterium]
MRGRWEVLLAIGGIVVSFSSGARAQSCEPAAASVISVQGDVDVSDSDRADWRDVQLNQVLCAGQQVRLMAKSRAVLRLPNETLLHLDEGSVLTLRAVAPEKPAWLEFLRGAVHIISRVPRALNIHTPFVNAGIEGTEFALRVDPAQAELWVYEGRVRLSNPAGQLLVASGEAAIAPQGQAPQRRIVVKPRRAVEWALYYPPLLDSRPQSYPEALRPAVLAYRRNDLPAAFAALDGVPEGARDARYHTLRAGLLLSVGRVPEAEGDLRSAERLDPKNGTAYALRSVIAVVRNEGAEALKLAAEAVRLAPGSATPYVARSYAEQSAFEIEKAHESLEKAAELAPEDALVWARLAELELSRGDLDAALEAATKAETLDPDLARTRTVLGFAYLTRIEVDKAKSAFDRALVLDPADPLPRLGMGLAKIRDGDLDAGTKEIEIAASLDPNNSLVRSYLGKAYYEQKRGGLAETEFEQAKLLDPKDPTPWFYDAIHKQTTNRPVEALHDLQKAIDLNDNRAVYRSRLLLDQDLAARSAALGRIYRDLGFEQRALVEGWRSVNIAPSDYSAHRLLADSYSGLPRHEIARVSELLQSQLLQPLNVTSIQPQLAESNLQILEGGGPASPAFNEFNPLFLRDRIAFQGSGLAGDNDTYADEVTLSGIWKNLSYSIGQFHYETNGFRQNDELRQDIYSLFSQASLLPQLSVQAELRYRETQHGNLALDFDPELFPVDFDDRVVRNSTVRLGSRFSPTPNTDVVASLVYQDVERGTQRIDVPLSFSNNRVYSGEGQYIFGSRMLNLVTGGGYYDVVSERATRDLRTFHGNGYSYAHLRYPDLVTWTFGISYDSLSDGFLDNVGNINQVNPKFGLRWDIRPDTTLRLAGFRVLKRHLDAEQTIEPTQVAGFNQFFDDFIGTDAARFGIGLDHRFSPSLYAGIEFSKRNLNVPIRGEGTDDWDEELFRGYLNWTPYEQWALALSYLREDFESGSIARTLGGVPPSTITETVPLSVSYYHPNGFYSRVQATYVNQSVELPQQKDGDEFILADVA